MTRYAKHTPPGIFPASDFQNRNRTDSTKTIPSDSVSASEPQLPPVPQKKQKNSPDKLMEAKIETTP